MRLKPSHKGRVWTGLQAKENGLIDELGGLGLALETAAGLAGIDEYNVTSYPKIEADFEDIFSLMSPLATLETQIKNILPKEVNVFLEAVSIEKNQAPKIQTQIPFSLDIK